MTDWRKSIRSVSDGGRNLIRRRTEPNRTADGIWSGGGRNTMTEVEVWGNRSWGLGQQKLRFRATEVGRLYYIYYWTFASSENSVVKGVKKFLQASGKAERSQMLIMLYQAKKLMASLGFAACSQELLSDRRARQLLNFLTTSICET